MHDNVNAGARVHTWRGPMQACHGPYQYLLISDLEIITVCSLHDIMNIEHRSVADCDGDFDGPTIHI